MGIKHTFVNPKSDGADTTIARPFDWNADHDIDGDVDFGGNAILMSSGGGINCGAGDVTITYTSNALTVAGGNFFIVDEAYDASAWDGNLSIPTKNAIRDYLETLTGTTLPAAYASLSVEDQALTGGVIVTSKSLGTVSSGTVTPDPGDRPQQHYTNGGAHTLGVSSNAGSILLDITNNGSAGAITTSGFTKVAGDSFTTTNGHKFRCSLSIGNAGSLLTVQALQ